MSRYFLIVLLFLFSVSLKAQSYFNTHSSDLKDSAVNVYIPPPAKVLSNLQKAINPNNPFRLTFVGVEKVDYPEGAKAAADFATNLISSYINFNSLAWGISERLIYTAGNGVVLYRNFRWEKIDTPELNTIYGIKGQNYNDIYGISTTSSILHFNGYSWQSIKTTPNSVFYSLDVKNNLTVTCGWQGDKALITILKK